MTTIRALIFSLLVVSTGAFAETLSDQNGDGFLIVTGFGDSITFGVGDGTEPNTFVEEDPLTNGEAGYLERVRRLLGVETRNEGVPGELFVDDGILRLISLLKNSNSDYLSFMEGVNDGIFLLSVEAYRTRLQQAVNLIRFFGQTPLLLTIPPPCCERESLLPSVTAYNNAIREVSLLNNLILVDIERAFASSCKRPDECEFLAQPKGLHPNTLGYEMIGQLLVARLLDINLFTQDGARELEAALGLEEGAVLIEPDEIVDSDSSDSDGEQA